MSEPNTPAPQLKLSALLVLGIAVAAFIFSSAFETPPPLKLPAYLTDEICGTVATEDATETDKDDTHQGHGDKPAPDAKIPATGPQYFAGGLWSDQLGLATLSELATSLAVNNGRAVAYSVSWQADNLVAVDVSPIKPISKSDAAPALAVVSIDHTGPDPSPEFGTAIQKFVESLTSPQKIVVLPPLPGKDKVPDSEFPYDWTYLMINDKVDVVDWTLVEPKADIPGYAKSGYLLAWLGDQDQDKPGLKTSTASELLADLDTLAVPKAKFAIYTELLSRGPYEVVPALNKHRASNNSAANLTSALLLHRLLDVSADELIKSSATSENPALRVAAARAIGDLADQTTDPIGQLTLLAEDREMSVRQEALAACYQIGGRAAAGVAQLVEAYEMSGMLRSTYEAVMPALLAAGPPIQPDSRANRLRRMPITELINEERDALACKILLERTDLPDAQIPAVLKSLAEATGQGPLTSLLNLLETMNPQAITKREALLKTLADWKANELEAQTPRLIELANQAGRPKALQAATAGALIRATPQNASLAEVIGLKPVLFEGYAWVGTSEMPEQAITLAIETALTAPDQLLDSRIAALDALKSLPDSAIKPNTVTSLLKLARTADNAGLRFAAIRAINALPAALKPSNIDDLALTQLTLRAVPGELRYDTASLTVTAGRPVEITLINPDTMPHNLVITTPGDAQPLGMQVTQMDPTQAASIGYVPESQTVLHHTVMVPAGQSDTLRFIAPTKPGNYDYVCTFPGHYTTMIGVLQVVAP